MPLAQLSPYHRPGCSGCPDCREDYAEMLMETPTQTAVRCAAETHNALRAAGAAPVFRIGASYIHSFRVAVKKTESEWRDHFGHRLRGYGSVQPDPPPDPYATDKTPRSPCPFDDRNYNPRSTPPDPYAIALAKKETTR